MFNLHHAFQMGKLNIKPDYDIVVIGAGMGGLTAAAMLSKAGYAVLVLEMASQVGGYLAGFHRNRFRFDTAIHWLNQCKPGGMVNTVFESIGSDYPKAITQQHIKRFIGQNHDYLLSNNPDQLKQQLLADFPHERAGIERFFKDAKVLGEKMDKWGSTLRSSETMDFSEKVQNGLKTFRFIFPFIKHVRFSGDKGLKKGLSRYFKEEKLQALFSTEPDLLSCLIPIGWAYFSDFQNPPKGGGQAFPEWLAHVIAYFKNDIFFHSKVNKILLEGNTAKGVAFEHRGEHYSVQSRYVIAACDVETLYEKMLPETAIPTKLKAKLRKAELYDSSVTVAVALDCHPAELGFGEEMIHISSNAHSRLDHASGEPDKSEIIILAPSLRDETMAPAGQGTITIFMPAHMSHHEHWKAEMNDKGEYVRGEAYNAFKTQIAEQLIQRVEEKVAPGLRAHILFFEVATPITHQRYTGNKNGTMMGARPGKENMQANVAHYRTAVDKLILSGHWAELGGGVPIAVKSGFNAALLVLKDEKPEIFKAYVDYLDKKISAEAFRALPIFKQYDNFFQQALTPAEMLANRRKGN
jgi:prolycopene isomerase